MLTETVRSPVPRLFRSRGLLIGNPQNLILGTYSHRFTLYKVK
jgi:hypothetical protein